jgi:hypothetical protein
MIPVDLTGKKFGRLTVKKYVGRNHNGKNAWLCECKCGNFSTPITSYLTGGYTKSCGCLNVENRKKAITTHGKHKSTEYRAYYNMLTRCYYTSYAGYARYGGRGIKVCKRWINGTNNKTGFEYFLADMGLRPAKNMSLDRINNDRNYEPSNCKWSTRTEQNSNKCNNLIYVWNGDIITLKELCNITKASYDLARHRLKYNWSIEDALTIKPLRYENYA